MIHFCSLSALLIRSVRRGLAFISQRRGATPFVLLLNFSGQSSANSGTSDFTTRWLCSADTPFTEWLPRIARLAIRTCFS